MKMFLSLAVLLSLRVVDVMGWYVPTSSAMSTPSGTPSSIVPLPTPTCTTANRPADKIDDVVKALEYIAPKAAVEECEDDTAAPHECRTAKQAAEPILASFGRYCITSPVEKAALVSLMAFESGEFKYQRNVYPGRPGQGTRNMQMIKFNRIYAQSLYRLKDLYELVKDNDDAVLDLLLTNDDFDFGSAAWFLSSQCTSEVRRELQCGSDAGWERYLTECIGTEVTDERREYMERAKEVANDL